ncbi:sugar ABC transporter permease [Mangrovactinospora gilvigrisea]|uniref:Sugar ABC transporter permease n=1 Tax=Mangrovactinospora gilvigrisea TaxID=1428644 RepID=A0A1J7C767_9ACTN|nr:carbohydrate ABC transporter permease [Mangrovactinospora gilvigrisea]OIV35490.1 sugar ABC transporter permease [Mangrovactinospora gilvigrisea]
MATLSVRENRSDRAFTVTNYTVLTFFLLLVLYPLVYVLAASVSSPAAVTSGHVWLWPVHPSLEAYHTILQYKAIVTGFANSIFYAVVGTFISVTLTLFAAYPLSRPNLRGRNIIMVFFTIPMLFSGGIIPTYLVVHSLGLLDTRWALVLPGAVAVWNVIVTRTFYKATLPEELHEAAQVDGCSDFRFFFRIVLPLSKPVIAVNALFVAVTQWNQYFNALIYLTTPSKFPLQLILREILVQNIFDPSQIGDATKLLAEQNLQELLKYALIVVATVPPLIAYPFVQKHFVKGLMIGSLKG